MLLSLMDNSLFSFGFLILKNKNEKRNKGKKDEKFPNFFYFILTLNTYDIT